MQPVALAHYKGNQHMNPISMPDSPKSRSKREKWTNLSNTLLQTRHVRSSPAHIPAGVVEVAFHEEVESVGCGGVGGCGAAGRAVGLGAGERGGGGG